MTKEIFAQFGCAVYLCQCIEKGIMHLLIVSTPNITRDRYDELLYEKSQLTFGQLKREIKQMNLFLSDGLIQIDRFHEIRDRLAHSYWWDRAVEFSKPELQPLVLKELIEIIEFLEILNESAELKARNILSKNGANLEELVTEMLKFESTPPMRKFRKLGKTETLLMISKYRNANGGEIPIFELEDHTLWTVCENGLSQFQKDINRNELFEIDKCRDIFPIRQFNPRSAISANWHYDLDLKRNGLKMKIRPVVGDDNRFITFRWRVEK
ncbi:hypothetical protein [Larkinella sp. C7]|uniref:hypothetical protein n=1 Tax=Larkinella sp. C7 TaxID=2576607 RepID=UPI00111143A1|nr:hypothetical protein [Larkinella sp. C7]